MKEHLFDSSLFQNFEKKTFLENYELIPHHVMELYKHGSVDIVEKIILQLSTLKRAIDEAAIVAITDKEGTITYVNKKFCEISKYSKEELLGQNHRILKSGYHPDAFYTGMWKTISTGHIWKGEVKNKAKDGTFYWVKTLILPILNDKGTPSEYISIRIDTTELHETKQKISDLKTSKLTVVGALAASIAHDIRNPLSIIKNSLDVLVMKLGPKLSENELEDIARMRRATSRITHQVEDVLDYVRISPLNINLNSLREITNVVIKKLDIPQNIKIHITSESDLELFCDNEKMEIVFTNLIINAIHAIGKELGHIEIRLKKESDYAIIEIEDSGPPIPEHVLEHMFEPLFTTKQVGTGLGLTSCNNIVKQHDGTITLKTNPTKFTIKIPIKITNGVS